MVVQPDQGRAAFLHDLLHAGFWGQRVAYGRKGMAGGQVAVTGWNPGLDNILLQSYPAGEAASALAGAVQSGGNTLLTLSDGTAITFVGVNTLSAANFL